MMTLKFTDYECGYRHGKRDYCTGYRSETILAEDSEYAIGYRFGLEESKMIQAEWLEE